MSLVNTLMNGNNNVYIDRSKYTHIDGATRIATESIEELHEIFKLSYTLEQAELAAVHEGVDLWDSRYSYVAEGAITDVITKIKEFFKKLWAKVKEFLKSIRMHLDALFMSAKDFVKKYKKVIDDANKDIRDFEYKMYDYDNDKLKVTDAQREYDVAAEADSLFDSINTDLTRSRHYSLKDYEDKYDNGDEKTQSIRAYDTAKHIDAGAKGSFGNYTIDDAKKLTDPDEAAKEFADKVLKGSKVKVTEMSDLNGACFAYFRNGAESSEDKEDIEIKDLNSYVDAILNSNKSALDKYANKIDKTYSNVIKRIDDVEKNITNKFKGNDSEEKKVVANATQILRYMSQNVSLRQKCENTLFTEWKSAVVERDNTYKSMLLAAVSNAKKNKKNK